MRTIAALTAAVIAVAIQSPQLAGAIPDGSAVGRLVGTVRLTEAGRRPTRAGAYAPRAVHPRPARGPAETDGVVVFVRDAPAPAVLPVRHAAIRQAGERFVPTVVAVTRGSSVEFPNEDPFFHNVFSLSSVASFDLGRYPRGDTRGRAFERAGLVKVFCDLHSFMSAVILVFDHPYFTKPGADGAFALEGIPAGRYTVVAWHDRIGESPAVLTVEPARTTEVHFSLPVLDP